MNRPQPGAQPPEPRNSERGVSAGQVGPGSAVGAPATALGKGLEKKEEKVLKVLWVSRHKPVPKQVRVLNEIAAKRGLRLKLDQFAQTVPSAEWLVGNVIMPGGFAVVVPVLPLSFIAHLVEEGKKKGFEVWFSKMQLLHNDARLPCPEYTLDSDTIQPSVDEEGNAVFRHYRFARFERIIEVKMVTEPVEVG